MQCREIHDRLIEAVEDELPERAKRAFQEHLAGCAPCRSEFEALRGASVGLRDAVPDLAPAAFYLTSSRRERLLAACARKRKLVRLVTWRRFAAMAAAAAIIAAAPFVVSDLVRLFRPPPDADVGAGSGGLRYVVALSTPSPDEAGRAARFVPVRTGAVLPADRTVRSLPVVRTDTPGSRIPVHHAFYDSEESSLWW